ncbi:MAG: protein tyrosine phosphatase family protein [Pseudomonadota bacterium]
MTELDHILNWRRIDRRLTTSGQPDKDQLAEIRDIGVTHIVNLGLGHGEGSLKDEDLHVAALGMAYTHIPVDFKAPTREDFEAFKAVIEGNSDSQMHVHCIYNARVSAFFYRYANSGGQLSGQTASAPMESIWRPGDDWATFIGKPEAMGQPNRYAGEDY